MIRWILFLCFFINTSLVFSQGFIVDDYRVDIYLYKAGYFDVVEKYEITFTERKHGIFRNILTKYDLNEGQGKLVGRSIVIDDIEVPHHPFTSSSLLAAKYNGRMEIKIGDEDKFVEGKQEYTIQYRVRNAFLFTDSASQFYWNIKSSDWPAFFNHISFSIHLPDELPLTKQDYFLYSGETGTTTVDETIPLVYTNGVLTGNSKPNLSMGMGDNMTILIKMPSDYIEKPSPLWRVWQKWGWLSFLLLVVFLYFYVWRVYGKDRYILKIVHYFPPKGMDPAMAGYLMNDQEDNRDLISLIPYWGAAGLLSLEEIPKKGIFGKKDTLLKKLAELPTDAAPYEKVMFTGLFPEGKSEVLISSLKNTFYTTMNSAKSILKKEAQRYYNQTSKRVSTIMMIVLVLMAIGGMVLSLVFWTIAGGIMIVICCVVLLMLNKIMQKRNEKGDEAVAEVYGFQRFVKTAEEEKLRVLLQDDPGYFEKSLGFALAFGLLTKWGRKFDHLNVSNPSWYHSTSGQAFSVQSFSNSFSSSISTMQSTMVSVPSSSGSSGGGSSGGGFGGGGGGSW